MMPPESAATSSRSSTGLAGRRVADRRRDLEHFVDRGDAGGDLHRAADAQGLHALLHRLLSHRGELGAFRGQRLNGAREHERLIDSDPPQIAGHAALEAADGLADLRRAVRDRKSTRLNSSHSSISYAVFCLKKKT